MCFLRLTILLAALLCGCGKNATRPTAYVAGSGVSTLSDTADLANAVLFRAMSLVGTRYVYGGNTPESGVDCSGLVGYVFRDAIGLRLPRTSAELGDLNRPEISFKHLQSGDLVLFADHRRISHVGIYVGNGQFVHAPNSGGTVRLDRINAPGWKETFRGGKRVIR